MRFVFWQCFLQFLSAEVRILGTDNGKLYIEKFEEDDVFYTRSVIIDGELPFRYDI